MIRLSKQSQPFELDTTRIKDWSGGGESGDET